MAFRPVEINDDIIWHTSPEKPDPALAAELREVLRRGRPSLLEFVHIGEIPPAQAATSAQWSRNRRLNALLAVYSDHIYRHDPTRQRENKPLLSLWAQWYFGILIPPLLLALLTLRQGFCLTPPHFHIEFHETGRAAGLWITAVSDEKITAMEPSARIGQLITQTLQPVVDALTASGEIGARLIWSNTGYLMNWYLADMSPLPGDLQIGKLRQQLFLSRHFADGRENPLWNTLTLRDGVLVRRTCCQRYRLPDVRQCGDCTLK